MSETVQTSIEKAPSPADSAEATEAHQRWWQTETRAREIRAALSGPIGNTLSQHFAFISGEERRISIPQYLERLAEEADAQFEEFERACGEDAFEVYKRKAQGISYAGETPSVPARQDVKPFPTLP
jgi:hypothetical protein